MKNTEEHEVKSNIFLFVGNNSYLLDHAVAKHRSAFMKDFGEHGVQDVFFTELKQPYEFFADLTSLPFLSTKRLFVVHGFPYSTQYLKLQNDETLEYLNKVEKDFLSIIETIQEDTQILFVSGTADKRKSGFKALQQISKLKDFVQIDGVLPADDPYASAFSQEQRVYVFERVGGDMRLYMNSMEKLALYSASNPLTKEIMFMLIPPSIEEIAFNFLQTIFARNIRGASEQFRNLLNQGENLMKLMGLLVWQVEQLFVILELQSKGKKQSEILELSGMKLFSYQKTLLIAKKTSLQEVCVFFELLIDFDKKLKTSVFSLQKEEQDNLVLGFTQMLSTAFSANNISRY